MGRGVMWVGAAVGRRRLRGDASSSHARSGSTTLARRGPSAPAGHPGSPLIRVLGVVFCEKTPSVEQSSLQCLKYFNQGGLPSRGKGLR